MKHFTIVLAMMGGIALSAIAQADNINWTSFEEAVELNKEEPRKFFIDFYTDWCGWCKRLDAVTFKDPEVIQLIDQHYYAIKFDAEQKEEIVFGEKTYQFVKPPNSRRGYHELAATIMQGRMSYPTMVILEVDESDSKVMILTPIAGYVDGTKLEPILEYLGKDLHLQEVNWEEYRANYAKGN
jgi:thioredoxin-related protein